MQESTLDQVISSNDALVNGFEILSPLGKSDHHCVLVDLNITGSMSTNTNSFVRSRKPLWGKMKDAEILRLAEDIDWSSSVIDNSETIWVELKEKMLSITEKVPSYNVNCGNVKSKRVPWENSSLKRARRDKDRRPPDRPATAIHNLSRLCRKVAGLTQFNVSISIAGF